MGTFFVEDVQQNTAAGLTAVLNKDFQIFLQQWEDSEANIYMCTRALLRGSPSDMYAFFSYELCLNSEIFFDPSTCM